jgi:hypothetical protein
VTILAVKQQQVLQILSMCLTLIIRNAQHMRRVILSPVAFLGLPHFPALSHKRYDFSVGEEVSEHKI